MCDLARSGVDCGPGCKTILGQVGGRHLPAAEADPGGLGRPGPVSDGLGQVSDGLGQAAPGLGQVSDGLGQVSPGLGQLKTNLTAASHGLAAVECGVDNTTLAACDAGKPGLLQGLGAVDAGVTTLVNGVVTQVQQGVGGAKDKPADKTLRGGVNGLQDGVAQIADGGQTLIDGLDQLGAGAGQLSDGSDAARHRSRPARHGCGGARRRCRPGLRWCGEAGHGRRQAQRRSGQLDDGLGRLSDGARQLDDGTGRLRTGAGSWPPGSAPRRTGPAGSRTVWHEAADGGKALPAGASRLSAEGTTKLVEAGKATASDYGQKYAVISAGAQRAKTEGMAFGAPDNAAGSTAYSLELAGLTGEGGRNVGRGAAALALFGLGGGGLRAAPPLDLIREQRPDPAGGGHRSPCRRVACCPAVVLRP